MITVLTGTNDYAIGRELNRLIDRLEPDVELSRISGGQLAVDDLHQVLAGASLFSPHRAVVLKDASSDKTLWERLGELLDVIDADMELIIVEPSLDKRTKTYKQLQKLAEIKQFDEVSEGELVNWLQAEAHSHGANLEPEAARFLIHYIGNNQLQLASELIKLSLASNSITRSVIETYCEPTPQASAFEVVDSVVGGQRDKLVQQLASLRQTEDPYRFFGLLSSQLGALTVCAAAGQRSSQQIAKDCGLHPYVAQKSLPLARRLGLSRLRKMNQLLADCDLQIKTSRGEPWQLLEVTIMKMTA